MKKICVYTCITGNYDNLQDVEIEDKKVDFICFTNNKNIKSDTWKVIYVEDESLNNHQLSRKIKMLGTDYINENYDISVWQDASAIWQKKPSDFVKEYFNGDFSACIHNERNSVFDEAKEVIRLRRDDIKVVQKHINFLKKEKFPDNLGLLEMTVFIKKHNDPVVKETMRIWFETYLKYSKRDQLSFMYAVWKTGLKLNPIPLNVWNNEWLRHIKHNYKDKLTGCRIKFGEDFEEDIFKYTYDYKYKIEGDIYSISTTIPVDTNVIEIEATDVPCLKFSNIEINCKYDSIQVFNTIPYDNNNIFYNNKGIIRITGKFKKKKKFQFSIKLVKLNEFEKLNIIERLATDMIAASEDMEILKNQREELANIVKEQQHDLRHPLKYNVKRARRVIKRTLGKKK